MTNFRIIALLLITQVCLGQTNSAIKIYLEDVVTGKNIADAKVTLEGFEIKPITGKYDPNEQYYFFDSIPKGYTTVMAYHKNYNEKGYQNTEKLPGELKLKMSNPYRIKTIGDTLNFYKEDKNKIAIVLNGVFKDDKAVDDYLKTNYPELILIQIMEANMTAFYCLTKKDKKDFKRFNDPIIKRLSEDKSINSVNGLLLKTKINIPKYRIYKEYFYENGKPNYIERYIKYVNYDTLDKPRNIYSRIKHSIAVKNVTPEEPEEYVPQIVTKTPKVNDLHLSYKEKFKKGLLHKDVYMLHQNELDSLYKIAEKRYKETQFYEYESTSNVRTDNRYANSGPFMPTYEFHYIPYAAVSNTIILTGKPKEKPKQDDKVLFSFTYKFVTEEEERKDFYSKYNLLQINREQYYNNKATYYKPKNLIASPFGISDVLEMTENANYEVKLETTNNISDPKTMR